MLQSTPSASSSKRQSIRLAKKAIANSSKGAIQVAQELLAKKLGELTGEDNTTNADELELELYMQHFDRPVELSKMEAIKVLIEEGNILQGAVATPSLEA